MLHNNRHQTDALPAVFHDNSTQLYNKYSRRPESRQIVYQSLLLSASEYRKHQATDAIPFSFIPTGEGILLPAIDGHVVKRANEYVVAANSNVGPCIISNFAPVDQIKLFLIGPDQNQLSPLVQG